MKTNLALMIGTTLLLASSAYAGGYAGKTGWYVGADAGVTRNHSSTSNLPACGVGIACSTDSSDSTWRLRGGYQFNPNWGVEGAYNDLGQTFDGAGTQTGVVAPFSFTGRQDTKAWSLAAVGKAPISQNRRLKAYGKVGVARWESKVHWNTTNPATSRTTKETGTDPVAGIGLEYDVSNQWTVRGGYDRHFNVGKNSLANVGTVEKDVDALTIGASFNF